MTDFVFQGIIYEQRIFVRKFITLVYLGNVQFINCKFNIFSKMLSSYPTCCITNDKDIGLLNAVIAFFVTFNYLVFIVYVNVFLHMFLVQILRAPNAIE